MTIKDKLDNLLSIQNIDLKLDEIAKMRGDLPEEIRELEDEIIALQSQMDSLESEIQNLENNITDKKNGITTAEQAKKNMKNSS